MDRPCQHRTPDVGPPPTLPDADAREALLRRPTVWPAPPTRARWTAADVLRAAMHGLGGLFGLAVGLVGPPLALAWWARWPLPSWSQLSTWWAGGASLRGLGPHAVVSITACGMWLLWAAFATIVAFEIIRLSGRLRPPRIRLAAPLAHTVTALLGVIVVAATALRSGLSPPPAGPPSASQPPVPTSAGDAGRGEPAAAPPLLPVGLVTVTVADQHHTYRVVPGDNLSTIAAVWLGDPDRWPEIYALNHGRHWPVGGTLTDPDLIYPDWVLDLPADARPPAAPPTANAPPTPPAPSPSGPSRGAATPTTDPDGVVEPPPTTPAPSQTAAPASHATAGSPASVPSDGVSVPGGFLPWAVAAAVSAAGGLVWLQRRRRFRPNDHEPAGTGAHPPSTLPPVVAEIRRQIHRRQPSAADRGPDQPPNPPALPHHPTHQPDSIDPADGVGLHSGLGLHDRIGLHSGLGLHGGIGLRGEGAPAAARAAVIAALAAGAPDDPDRRGEVVIDTATWHTLFTTDPPPSWPRLHLTADLAAALGIIETRLLHRARVLDEHGLTDLGTLRERAPCEETLPPLLLVTMPPPHTQQMRTHAALALGTSLDITAIILGTWDTTIEVTTDGHTPHPADAPSTGAAGRLAVLDEPAAAAILTTLHEAHTGHAPTPDPATAVPETTGSRTRDPASPSPPQPPRTQPAGDHPDVTTPLPSPATTAQTAATPTAATAAQVQLRILGTPKILDITRPGRPLRGKAAELAVYLACHPDGADTDTIAEHLTPEVRRRQARQQVHTNASNLRHVLGRAGGFIDGGYVLKRGTNARYRLDPTTVTVDLWQLRDLLTRARLTCAPTRTDLLRQACKLATAPLAHGCDYEWIEPHREQTRRWGTEAHLLLAEDLLESDPHAASDLLDHAISLDHYNEELYRKAMHARHALGSADGIHALLRALTKTLADLDAEPDETTVELAATLRASLKQR